VSLQHRLAVQLVSRDWQRPDHCRYDDGLSSEHEDDQVDVSSPDQVNDWMTERLDSEERRVQELLTSV